MDQKYVINQEELAILRDLVDSGEISEENLTEFLDQASIVEDYPDRPLSCDREDLLSLVTSGGVIPSLEFL
jgi:hypothetical protein